MSTARACATAGACIFLEKKSNNLSTLIKSLSDKPGISQYYDKDGNIISIGADDVEFSPTLGTIVSKTEDGDGRVIATLASGNNAGPSTITAAIQDPPVTSPITVTFVAAGVGSVKLEASKTTAELEQRVPEAQRINAIIVELMSASDNLTSAAAGLKDADAKELASAMATYSKMLADKVRQAGLGRM